MTPTLKTATPSAKRGIWSDLLWENPMFDEAVRAFRKFVRGGSNPGRALNYVAIGLIGFFYLWLLAAIVHSGENFTIGILYFELVVVTLMVPLSIYGAVAGERERSTWEALILTRLTPAQIAAGKLLWRMLVLVAVLMILAVPIVISQIIKPTQGPSTEGIVAAEVLILAWGILLCAFGLWVSVNSRRSVTAMGTIVGAMLATLALFPLIAGLFGISTYSYSGAVSAHPRMAEVVQFLLDQNPFVAINDVTTPDSATRYVHVKNEAFMPTSLIVYITGIIVFMGLTQISLRRLEEPQRK